MPKVIVHGPEGCGKSLSAQALARKFGCSQVVDEWDGVTELPDDTLALTNVPPPYAVAAGRVVAFEEAV